MLLVDAHEAVEISRSLLWVLGHSIWQSTLIAGGVALALRMLPARRANLRYSLTVAGLLAVVLATMATWSWVRLPTDSVAAAPVQHASLADRDAHTNVGTTGNSDRPTKAKETAEILPDIAETDSRTPPVDTSLSGHAAYAAFTTWVAPGVVTLWGCGCAIMLLRALRSLAEVRILLRESPATPEEARRLSELRRWLPSVCQTMGMRTSVRLQRCSHLASPAVVGILWPVILVPASMLTGNALSADQWRIILAHELAHVRRLDGVINLAQLLIESLLFFSPAVWWLSRQARIEREACCDALAARVTGQRVSVARTLLTVAETTRRDTLASRGVPPTAWALAFWQPKQPSLLRDRVQRLANPNHRPGFRAGWVGLTWLGVFLVIVLLVGLVVTLQVGTDAAVRTAAALLSPSQRVDELARLQAKSTGVYAPTADGTAAPHERFDANSKVVVRILVRTADGSPIANGVSVTGTLHRPGESASMSIAHRRRAVAKLELEHEFRPGNLRLAASAPGFAPVASEVITISPDMAAERSSNQPAAEPTHKHQATAAAESPKGTTNNPWQEPEQEQESAKTTPSRDQLPLIELVLTPGFSRTVQVLDEHDHPVDGVELSIRGQLASDGMRAGLSHAKYTVDVRDGSFSLQHLASDIPYQLEVLAAGWEYQQDELEFDPQVSPVIRLRRAQPTLLTLVDAETGAPVTDATVLAAGWSKNHQVGGASLRWGDPRQQDPRESKWAFGESDSAGVASVDMLNRDYRYLMCVRADGYRPEFVDNVRAGNSNRTVRLRPAIVFSGQVRGDLSLLPSRKREGRPTRRLRYRNVLNVGSHRHSGLLAVDVDADGRFRIDDLVTGGMRFSLPSGTAEFPTDASREDIILDLSNDAQAETTAKAAVTLREVTVRLTQLPADTEVRGSLRFQWRQDGRWQDRNVPVVDRQATLALPVDVWFSVREYGLVGAVFKEQNRVPVPAGDGPMVHDVPAVVAGGVHGVVVRADGTPANVAGVTILEVERSTAGRIDPNPSVRSHADRFFRTLPFGGRYAVLAREFTEAGASWVVSDTFTIDEQNPIQHLKLQLPVGEPTRVRVVTPAGQPMPDAAVELSIGHSVSSHSYSRSVSRRTDSNGWADFGRVVRRGPAGDAKLRLTAVVQPSESNIGTQEAFDGSQQSSTIIVQPAVSASGMVVDLRGEPVVDAEISVYPADYKKENYRGHIRSRTDSEGRFRLTGLEAIRYRVNVPSTAPADAVVTKQPDGSLRYSYPNDWQPQYLTGGAEQDQTIRVQRIKR